MSSEFNVLNSQSVVMIPSITYNGSPPPRMDILGSLPGSPPWFWMITPEARPCRVDAMFGKGKSCNVSPFTDVTAETIFLAEVVP